MNWGSTKGRWTVFIPAMTNRFLNLHIFYRSHATDVTAVHDQRTGEVELVKRYRVELKMIPLDDNEPDPSPALKASGGFPPDDNDVFAFLQAMVDEAAKVGIRASGSENLEDVLSTTTSHLEDMRRLVFGEKPSGYQRMNERTSTR